MRRRFFPLNLSVANSDPDQLTGLCQALCPNAPVSVYTRTPFQEISTAVSLDGDSPYSDLPNALKFEKILIRPALASRLG